MFVIRLSKDWHKQEIGKPDGSYLVFNPDYEKSISFSNKIANATLFNNVSEAIQFYKGTAVPKLAVDGSPLSEYLLANLFVVEVTETRLVPFKVSDFDYHRLDARL